MCIYRSYAYVVILSYFEFNSGKFDEENDIFVAKFKASMFRVFAICSEKTFYYNIR